MQLQMVLFSMVSQELLTRPIALDSLLIKKNTSISTMVSLNVDDKELIVVF